MAITTGSEVRFIAGLTSEYTNDEISSEIDLVEAEMYSKYSLPKRSQFTVDSSYTNFYIYPDQVYEIVRVQVAVTTDEDPSGYLTVATGSTTWSHTSPNNYITLEDEFIAAYPDTIVRVSFIPIIHNLIAKNTTALNLIETTTIVDGRSVDSPLATRIIERIKRYKDVIKPKGLTRSSANVTYDKYEYISYDQLTFR